MSNLLLEDAHLQPIPFFIFAVQACHPNVIFAAIAGEHRFR